MRDPVSKAFRPYGTSIFTEMSALSDRAGAVNLSQGFPDFDGPEEIRRLAAEALLSGPNQYTPSHGLPRLREAIGAHVARFRGVHVDPDLEVTVTAGATEALAASLLGLVDPGDEVVLLEPCYDLYPPIVERAGGSPVFVPLRRPGFALDRERLERAFGPRTRAIVVNNPHNPCGLVLSREDLTWLGALCERWDAIAIGDEVYEHLVYDGRRHVSLLEVPALRERSVVISSTAKTFSMTGWKVGWALASPPLTRAVRMCHQYLVFCTPGALQRAMAEALGAPDRLFEELLRAYTDRRARLCAALTEAGLRVLPPEGTYYAMVDIGGLGFQDDRAFCEHLIQTVGVAAIPISYFYRERRDGRDLVRFCFCKRDETLAEAAARLLRRRP